MKKTLVIMAAGMGSRFGALKQIEPVGPNGEIIADYSVYDAKRAGFSKVIFIIHKENEEYFRQNIINKYQKIDVELAYQELEYVPNSHVIPKNRTKMLGTAHALYCCKNLIDSDFVIINSDDFYGFDSFKIAANLLDSNDTDYVSINYPYIVTSSKFGKVKRGIVEQTNGIITNITESEIGNQNGKIMAKSLQTGDEFEISKDTPVAVNFFGLKKKFLDILDKEMNIFLENGVTLTNEFLLPEVLKKCLDEKSITLKSLVSSSKWIGMTYKEDLETVKNHINNLIERGDYPSELWWCKKKS